MDVASPLCINSKYINCIETGRTCVLLALNELTACLLDERHKEMSDGPQKKGTTKISGSKLRAGIDSLAPPLKNLHV
jgi:hypothetical protein